MRSNASTPTFFKGRDHARIGQTDEPPPRPGWTRLGSLGAALPAWAAGSVKLPLPGGPDERALTTAFPGKGEMILQRTHPPLLETCRSRCSTRACSPPTTLLRALHWASIPTEVDAGTFRLKVHGHVEKELSLSLDAIAGLPRFEIAAVNQCSGNSRGLFEPRVPGAQWANGSMGNARWTGVRLKDVLEKAGVKAGAVQVRFKRPRRAPWSTTRRTSRSPSISTSRQQW